MSKLNQTNGLLLLRAALVYRLLCHEFFIRGGI